MRYGDLADRVARLAGAFARRGLAPGDRLAVYARKTASAVTAFLAGAAAGGVFYPVDSNQPPAVVRAILDQTAPRIVCVAAEFAAALEELYPGRPPFAVVVLDGPAAGGLDTLETLAADPFPASLPLIGWDDPVYLNFTSGTTGAPKGAVTTLGNLLSNTQACVEVFGLTAEDVHLCMMPVFVHPHETQIGRASCRERV